WIASRPSPATSRSPTRRSTRRAASSAMTRRSKSRRAFPNSWIGFGRNTMPDPVLLLRELIALPSVNPAFLSAHDPSGGERAVAEHLQAVARRAGLEVETQKVLPNRSNLIVRLRPTGRTHQRVALAPHMDTVGVSSHEQFTPVQKQGRIYGRGAC